MLKGKKAYTLGQSIYPGIYVKSVNTRVSSKKGKYHGKYSSVVGCGGLDF